MRFITAGESHGPALTAIVEGVPAGVSVSERHINADLRRRQMGYGRGARQCIESDEVSITSGVRFGVTLGSPVTLVVRNRDAQNWADRMAPFGKPPASLKRETRPRPGHADLVGVLKVGGEDCRDVIERASARSTAALVAAAGIAREFLAAVGVNVFSYVTSIGSVSLDEDEPLLSAPDYKPLDIEVSELRCPSLETTEAMKARIDEARAAGESLGGAFRVVATGLLPGLGGYATPSDRLSARIGGALFGIPSVKGVEFGLGFAAAGLPGSQVHDAITLERGRGFGRATNRAGGLEGGMTTGLPLVVTCAVKPIPTLMSPLDTIDLDTLESVEASCERSDVCAVPSAAVVAEAQMAFCLAEAYLSKFGRDDMASIRGAIAAYRRRLGTMSK
ncbi:chorismate synthase [Eggerthellaceae bacterium zg-1084]|uniref:chorismate synthase n=1 Tax=Berryella wangjianweii TaxID=2734634 RepID=UPI001556BD8A|nr:chorismate synthase [Berryella wangjianweii]NPD30849.1 chorismate synthase [Berryella wangjianweii]NPD31716.1 chorismate synthase [Eggerthellaceae bacterium zg-997]